MLPHPTYDRLIALGLVGMAKAFEEQRQQPAVASLMFEERVGLLVDREAVERESRCGRACRARRFVRAKRIDLFFPSTQIVRRTAAFMAGVQYEFSTRENSQSAGLRGL